MSKRLSRRWSNSSTIGSVSPQSTHGCVTKYSMRYLVRSSLRRRGAAWPAERVALTSRLAARRELVDALEFPAAVALPEVVGRFHGRTYVRTAVGRNRAVDSTHHGEWRSLVAHPAGGRAVAGSNPVSPIRESPAFDEAFFGPSSFGRRHGEHNGEQTQGCVSLGAGTDLARVCLPAGGGALTPEQTESHDTRIMIPLFLRSTEAKTRAGGHERGHIRACACRRRGAALALLRSDSPPHHPTRIRRAPPVGTLPLDEEEHSLAGRGGGVALAVTGRRALRRRRRAGLSWVTPACCRPGRRRSSGRRRDARRRCRTRGWRGRR